MFRRLEFKRSEVRDRSLGEKFVTSGRVETLDFLGAVIILIAGESSGLEAQSHFDDQFPAGDGRDRR